MTTTRAKRLGLGLAVAVLTVSGACSNDSITAARPDPVTPPPGGSQPLVIDPELISTLEAFEACDDLLAYLRTEGAKVVGPYGFDGGGMFKTQDFAAANGRAVAAPTAAAAGGSASAGRMEESDAGSAPATTSAPSATDEFSATNVQEAGVDEPDLVKTDGKRLVTIAAGQLRLVDLTGPSPRLAASLRIGDNPYVSGDLLLAGDRVIVLHQQQPNFGIEPMPAPSPGIREGDSIGRPFRQGPPRTAVTVVDITDVSSPKVVDEVVFDGDLVASRMVDGVARLVLRSGPPNLSFLFPSGSEASVQIAKEANAKVVAESTLEDWLPSYTVNRGDERRITECDDVHRPEVFSGVGMLSVVTVDAADPRPGPAATVIGAGEMTYASTKSLFVTSTAWIAPETSGRPTSTPQMTDIHKFDIADKVRTTYAASGRVQGRLLNSFAMSEHDGHLRVATTDDLSQESAVTVLRQDGERLGAVGTVGGLGKNERIYAVRFLGTRGYVVTFRQTDPLYVVDLADPTTPTVKGELKIPGYSAYLHPMGDNRLIGVGQDANDQGRVQGTQVSLFDVSDPADPKRLANAIVPQSSSEAEFDHHAFLYWAKTGLLVLPVQSHQDGNAGAIGFDVTDEQITETGRIRHRDLSPVRRSLVVGDRLLTLSDTGLRTGDLQSLDERSWLVF